MKDTAAGLAALGRGPDTMLIHMSPREVGGLQALAKAAGGSLTLNPHTGLPEAGFLDNMLPTILGVGLNFMFPGSGALIGAGIGGIEAARTGNIGKGLMAGLGAYGGAGLGEALAAQGAGVAGHQAGLQAIGGPEAFTGANFAEIAPQTNPAITEYLADTNPDAVFDLGKMGSEQITPESYSLGKPTPNPVGQKYADAYQAAQPTDAMGRMRAAGTGLQNITEPGFMANLGQQFDSTGAKAAAGIGAIGALGGFEQPELGFAAPQQQASNYRAQGANRRPYDPTAPGGYYFADRGILQPTYAAKGGEMHSVPELEDGGFVLTKKSVDGMGKGDNKRGQRAAAAGLGAIPIKGPGTGTSDSIPTTIEGKRPALLSNGEAYVPRDQVKRRGGAKKFYALMKQAEREATRRA
jgi:hypothetical protein